MPVQCPEPRRLGKRQRTGAGLIEHGKAVVESEAGAEQSRYEAAFPYRYCGLPRQVDNVAVTNILPVEKTTMAGKLPDGKLDTVIGPGTTVKGDLHVTGGLRLDGQIEGEVDVGETFLAGPKSLLKGGLRCRDAVIAGRIEANIVAAETTELQAGAHVIGNIECKGLVIQKGSYFQGSCIMSKDQDNPTMAPPQEDRQ